MQMSCKANTSETSFEGMSGEKIEIISAYLVLACGLEGGFSISSLFS